MIILKTYSNFDPDDNLNAGIIVNEVIKLEV